jgi:flagellar biosynthesis protein FliQ
VNAVDDGIWSGNLDLSDALLLIAFVILLVAAVLYAAVQPKTVRWAPVALCVGVALIALGYAVL